MSTNFLALRLFCFNMSQHGRQILYFKLHVAGRKFHYRRPHAATRPQVVHRCAKSYRLHNWYNGPSKPFATSHVHACFALQKSRKSRIMFTALTFTAKSTSAVYCTSPTRDVEVHGLVVLRSEIPSGICAKLRTVAASNNRVYMTWSLYYCLFAPLICMVLFLHTHPLRGESHNHRNTTGEVATTSPPIYNEPHRSHVLHIAVTAPYCCDRKSRAAYTQSFAPWQQATIEIMHRNLSSRTLVIMFNHSHVTIGRASTSQSLLLLLARLTYIMVLFFAHIPFVVNHTINATPPERLQQL